MMKPLNCSCDLYSKVVSLGAFFSRVLRYLGALDPAHLEAGTILGAGANYCLHLSLTHGNLSVLSTPMLTHFEWFAESESFCFTSLTPP